MPHVDEAAVLIVGAGPVGLTLAIDLAWRGIKVTVVETRLRRAATGAQVQPCRGPDDGNLPAARHRRKGAQRRSAARLSARHQLPDDLYRAGADTHSNPLPA
jgi:thioredoxin reductase